MSMFMPDRAKMEENQGKSIDGLKEEHIIPAGVQPAQLVAYNQIGKHCRNYKGKPKPAETGVMLVFEFALAPYTGYDMLTWKTSTKWKEGEFFDWLSISDALMNNELSPSFAAKTNYMTTLASLNAASDKEFSSIYEALGEVFSFNVIHVANTAGVMRARTTIKPKGGDNPIPAVLNTVMRHPQNPDQVLFDSAANYPKRELSECTAFDMHNPTEESWSTLKPWEQVFVKEATDYPGSALEELLIGSPDLDVNADKVGGDTKDVCQTPVPIGSGSMESKGTENKLHSGTNSDAVGL